MGGESDIKNAVRTSKPTEHEDIIAKKKERYFCLCCHVTSHANGVFAVCKHWPIIVCMLKGVSFFSF